MPSRGGVRWCPRQRPLRPRPRRCPFWALALCFLIGGGANPGRTSPAPAARGGVPAWAGAARDAGVRRPLGQRRLQPGPAREVVREEGPCASGTPFLAAGPRAWGLPTPFRHSALRGAQAECCLRPPFSVQVVIPKVVSLGASGLGLSLEPGAEPGAGLPLVVQGASPPIALSRAPARGLGCAVTGTVCQGLAAHVGRTGGSLRAAGWSGSGPGSLTRPSAPWRAPK